MEDESGMDEKNHCCSPYKNDPAYYANIQEIDDLPEILRNQSSTSLNITKIWKKANGSNFLAGEKAMRLDALLTKPSNYTTQNNKVFEALVAGIWCACLFAR